MLWYVDLLGYLLTKKFFIGVATYITWPEVSKFKLLTTTHHLWFIPLNLWILKNTTGLNADHFKSSMCFTIGLSILARLLTPKTIKTKNSEVYMNINLAYELWKGIEFKFLKVVNDSSFFKTLMF
jgi:hypothetical protein